MDHGQRHRTVAAKRPPTALWWVAAGAIAMHQLGISLLNSTLFPLFNGILLEARDVSTLLAATLALALYLATSKRPDLARPRMLAGVAAGSLALGFPIMFAGIASANPAALLTGACLRAVGSVWLNCMVSLTLACLATQEGLKRTFLALCTGWAAAYLLEYGVSFVGLPMQLGAFCTTVLLEALLVYRPSSRMIAATLGAQPASELRITNPRSFLPLWHTVFVTLILLKMSFGFAMTFANVDATPQSTVLACVPALVIALALAAGGRFGLNHLYKAAILCVLAGFLLVNPIIREVTGAPAVANVFLRAGSDLTRMLAFLLAAHVGSRNPMNALNVALFVSGANSLGSFLGAQLGLAADALLVSNPGAFALLLAAVVFAFVAYNVLAPDGFKLDETVQAIQTVEPPRALEPSDRLAYAVARLAADHGLTPREAEALELLAHGRNTAAIQERMVVSRSTAKTHIRNVYTKLGVHAQQELIDLVEQTEG